MEKTKTQPTNVVSSGCGHCYAETLIPAKGRKDLFALIRKDRGQQTIMKINRGLLARLSSPAQPRFPRAVKRREFENEEFQDRMD